MPWEERPAGGGQAAEQQGGGCSAGQSPFPAGEARFEEQICPASRGQTRVPPSPLLPAPLDATGNAPLRSQMVKTFDPHQG